MYIFWKYIYSFGFPLKDCTTLLYWIYNLNIEIFIKQIASAVDKVFGSNSLDLSSQRSNVTSIRAAGSPREGPCA